MDPPWKAWRQVNVKVEHIVVDGLLQQAIHSFHPPIHWHVALDESYSRSTDNIPLKLNNLP